MDGCWNSGFKIKRETAGSAVLRQSSTGTVKFSMMKSFRSGVFLPM
jgi:hypothetical protein